MRRTIAAIVVILSGLANAWRPESSQAIAPPQYRLEPQVGTQSELARRFTPEQIGLLEKLNRADRAHLSRLSLIVVPEVWTSDELAYSVFPPSYPSASHLRKLLLVHVPGQMFAAYERGVLVRWGPINSGARSSQTEAGLFSLNWKSEGHASSVDPDWFMRWYFNFDSRDGLALHEYALPGRPVSHGCLRMLQRDAMWLFDWGEEWVPDRQWGRVLQPGTPLFIVGAYDFDAPPPWQSREWLGRTVELPPYPGSGA